MTGSRLTVCLIAAGFGAFVCPSASPSPVRPPRADVPIELGGQGSPHPDQACQSASYECAVLRLDGGDPSAAVHMLRDLAGRQPRDLKVLNLLGIALSRAGEVDEANARFREALGIDPGFVPALKNLAINEFGQGRLSDAEDLLDQVFARAPADEIAHAYKAEIHYARGEAAQAIRHYEKAGARLGADPRWVLHYAACVLEGGETALAVAILDRLPPGDAASRFEAGVALGRAQAHADAARFFGDARAGARDAYAAGFNQTLMLIEAGDAAAAIAVAEDLFRQGVRRGELYNLVSRAYVAAGRIQDAYDALRTAARLEPTEEQHYLDLALICLDHENFELGMEIIDLGLRYLPRASRLVLYRGVLLIMQGRLEEAEREFERAKESAPSTTVPDVALAMAWIQSGQMAKAVTLLRRRAGEAPRDPLVPYMFGVALVRSGVESSDAGALEAVQAFEEAIRLDPRLAGARAELGKILLRRGEIARAIEQLEQAVRLDPDNAAPAYALAQAYRRTGDTARAQELLSQVSRLNAQSRGDDPDRELQRIVVRLVRQGGR